MTQDICTAKDELLRVSLKALKRAAGLARETAIQTGTHLVLVQDGQLTRVSPEELRSQYKAAKS